MFIVGVDGCREGWVVVALDGGRFAGAAKYSSFHNAVEAASDAIAIGVNLPIGLMHVGERYCDALTKKLVGPLAENVMTVPPREVIEADSYEDAVARSRALMGRVVDNVVYDLRDKILEVDAIVRGSANRPSAVPPESRPGRKHPAQIIKEKKETRESLLRYARIIDRSHGATTKPAVLVPDVRDVKGGSDGITGMPGGRIIEVNADASFVEMAGKPLEANKSSTSGVMIRMRLLEKDAIVVPAELGEVGGVGADEVLDAAAAAWTANRYAHGRARTLPPRAGWQHDGERVVAIWI